MEYIKKIVYELLFFKRSQDNQTKWFITQKHNANLCPGFQKKFDYIFSSFEKYQKIVYDIQGPRDAGTDVIIRQTENDINKYICIQIKSEDDLKKKDYLKELKAQYFDTKSKFSDNILDFYIILCCDTNDKKNKDKIRCIENEFINLTHVYVVEPDYAFTFLHLSETQIDATIRILYSKEDIIYIEGLSIVQNLTPTQKAIIYFFICEFIYREKFSVDYTYIVKNNFIREFYKKIPDYSDEWFFLEESDSNYQLRELSIKERIGNDLERLDNILINNIGNQSYSLNISNIQPLLILMMDGNIRYGYDDNELIYYMLEIFGNMKGYEPTTIINH
ncbi:hypothetical protein [Priestia aryabhattai]|uniref:hypothetical protein n=1 Tax=Priestia aryabhattai TaxID=412384 RepID=UPI003B6708F4